MRYSCSLAVLGLVSTIALPANATVINSYDFNRNLTDTLGRGADLTSLGGNFGILGRYSFGLNQGLNLSKAFAIPTSYSIEIKFQINAPTTSSWHKVIDFENRTADWGLYIYSTSSTGPFGVQLYPAVLNGPSAFPLNADAIVRLTRDSATNEVEGFLNNVSQWKFIDTFNYAVPSGNLLSFFQDDTLTSGNESFVGSVDYIRISDNSAVAVVPEPNSFVIWSLLALTFFQFRSPSRFRIASPI